MHTVVTVPNSNRKIMDTETKQILLTHFDFYCKHDSHCEPDFTLLFNLDTVNFHFKTAHIPLL